MPSRFGRYFLARLRATAGTRAFDGEATARERIARARLSENASPPAQLARRYSIKRRAEPFGICYTIAPLGDAIPRTILYLHGGGYVYQLGAAHWKFLARLVDEARCTIVIPLYPLAPEFRFSDAFAMLLAAYEDTLSKCAPADLTLLGDSAGGGLALALAQLARNKGLPQPKEIVLISPWLDLQLGNPAIAELEPLDPLLRRAELLVYADMYAREIDRASFLLSPINGELHGLGRLTLLIGTREIFLADARRFRDLAENRGVSLEYEEYDGMVHVWALRTLPESRRARRRIVAAVLR